MSKYCLCKIRINYQFLYDKCKTIIYLLDHDSICEEAVGRLFVVCDAQMAVSFWLGHGLGDFWWGAIAVKSG